MVRIVHSQAARPVAYVTDVEGSWDRLWSFVQGNGLVRFDEHMRLVVQADATLVFGGDAIDRGSHGRRVVRTLLEARKRQPDQVVLLAGNRDINKLRIPRELRGFLPTRAPDDLRHQPRPEILRWILSHTMNAGAAFEHRRAELQAEGLAAHDDDVVASMDADLDPRTGVFFDYLRHCQLAFRSGVTLFVHGGISETSLGFVPDTPAAHDDADVWISDLNGFYARQLVLYAEHPIVPGDPPWLPIILYQAPRKGTGRNPHSVVYGRFGEDPWNNPRLPKDEAVHWLQARGVHRVVVGHTPCGDVPAILRECLADRPAFEVVMADNSRSRVETGTQLRLDDASLAYVGQAVLDDESRHEVRLTLDREQDSPIGLVTTDGRLVKGFLDDGRLLLFRLGEGFVIHQTAQDPARLGPLTLPLDR